MHHSYQFKMGTVVEHKPLFLDTSSFSPLSPFLTSPAYARREGNLEFLERCYLAQNSMNLDVNPFDRASSFFLRYRRCRSSPPLPSVSSSSTAIFPFRAIANAPGRGDRTNRRAGFCDARPREETVSAAMPNIGWRRQLRLRVGKR